MGTVVAVASDAEHRFSKPVRDSIQLIAGVGVDGDAHAGATVQHLSRARRAAAAPNLRQVHLIHAELLDDLAAAGFEVGSGGLGENVLTRGIDLLALSEGTELLLGRDAVVRVTGLRNPCAQIEAFRPGLLAQVRRRGEDGEIVRMTGVMSVVLAGGEVRPGDDIVLPRAPTTHRPLTPV